MRVSKMDREDLWLNVAMALVQMWAGVPYFSPVCSCVGEEKLTELLLDLEHVGGRVARATSAVVNGMMAACAAEEGVRDGDRTEASADEV